MRTRPLLLLALLVVAACSPAPVADVGPLEGPTRRVRLVTWNVENLFDSVDDPYEDDVLSPAQVEAKLEALASVLRSLDADLVALQEVENGLLLQDLARRTRHDRVILQEGNDVVRGIDVGFMARIPLEGYASHVADRLPDLRDVPPGYRFSRDCLEVHVDVPGGLVVLVNHLKSQAGGGRENDAKRLAQAMRVREIAESFEGIPLAVVGDLNAGPRSRSLDPLLRGPLVDVMAGLPQAGRITFRKRNRNSVLDYVLVNRALAPRVVPGSARVARSAAAEQASDHLPVVVDLLVPAAPGGAPSRPGEAPGR